MDFKFAKKIILLGLIIVFSPFFVRAATLEFNVDSSYDYQGRSTIEAFLHQLGEHAYFYVEEAYYQNLNIEKKEEFATNIRTLSEEFDEVIYPNLRETFGSEWKPGIDEDGKVTILLTRINSNRGGYFNSGDEYPAAQVLNSNEREMVYLNVNYVGDPLLKSYLSHEFLHLITFNQKEKTYGISEETWLNETRAEAAITLLGYDDNYQDSNLQKRVRTFSQNTDNSLTEWKNENSDYGIANIFIQYLIDHYGKEVLADSLKTEKIGIPSLNYALEENGFSEDFSQIFTDWSVAVLINDCQVGSKYCYLNPNLENLKILPQLNYLPLAGESTLKVSDWSKNWAGNWIKLIGGNGKLELEFVGNEKISFSVPYVTQDSSGEYLVKFLELDETQRGTTFISNFGTKYDSLTLIPTIQEKTSGFNGIESFYKFIWSASVIEENSEAEQEKIAELLAQIEQLKAQIAALQAKIDAILAKNKGEVSCGSFENNLYYGMRNNEEVECLQEFLKNQGTDVYPEGLVTGNFLTLTRKAVIRFQEKYISDILTPLGLEKGTGFAGPATRKKINKMLGE